VDPASNVAGSATLAPPTDDRVSGGAAAFVPGYRAVSAVDGVGVRTGVDEAVPVGRSATEGAALSGRLVVHRRQDPMAGADGLTL
jgi:hypothetical protein